MATPFLWLKRSEAPQVIVVSGQSPSLIAPCYDESVGRYLVFAILFLTCSALGAPEPPVEIDLSYQFDPEPVIQKGGSCHIFAATALVEAACFRRLGGHLGISQAQLFARHLRQSLHGLGMRNARPQVKGHFTAVDGSRDDERNILNLRNLVEAGGACSRDVFPLDDNFKKNVSDIFEASEAELQAALKEAENIIAKMGAKDDSNSPLASVWNAYLQRRLLPETRLDIELRMNKPVVPVLESALRSGAGAKCEGWIQTLEGKAFNQLLKKCLSTNFTLQRREEPSPATLLSLLKRKIPILCSTKIRYPDHGYVEGEHTFLITGIAHRSTTGPIWIIRDSNFKKPIWATVEGDGRLSCEEVFWVEP